MEEAARKFARRILIIHLALLACVILLVYFASHEIYKQTHQQVMEQAQVRQGLLASQTARGIESFYQSIFNDLDLLRQAPIEDADGNTIPKEPTTPTSITPDGGGPRGGGPGGGPPGGGGPGGSGGPGGAPSKIDWKSLFKFDAIPNAATNTAQTLLTGILWRQLEGRVTVLFGYNRDRGGRRFELPITMMGSEDKKLSPREIMLKSGDWLRTVDKPTIGPFQEHDLNGQKVGLNLVCVPLAEKSNRLLVAAVRIKLPQSKFLDKLNSDKDGTSAILIDDAGTLMVTPSRALVGQSVWNLLSPDLTVDARKLIGTGERGNIVIKKKHSMGGIEFQPGFFTAEPVNISGKKWTMIMVSPIAEVDAVVDRLYKRALLWAIFVVCSMTALLVSSSIQLIRGRVRIERMRSDVLRKEINQAREIQLAWLPREGVSVPYMDIAAINQPANHISGDFYNWFQLPDGRTVVTIGDVTGHGMSAAFLMATTQLLVHSTMVRVQDPGQTLQEVNRQLCMQVFNGQFVTMLICVIDVEGGSIEVATAGHYPPVLGQDGVFKSLPVEPQLVLAVEKDTRYPTERFELPASASLILYTDGVIDAQSVDGKRFDENRLVDSVKGKSADSAQSLVDSIIARVNQFRGARQLPDDLTLVCVQTSSALAYTQTEAVSV